MIEEEPEQEQESNMAQKEDHERKDHAIHNLTEPASEEEDKVKSVREYKVTPEVGQEDRSVHPDEMKNPDGSSTAIKPTEPKINRHLSASTTESTRQANT